MADEPIEIHRTSAERLKHTVRADVDPTAFPVEHGFGVEEEGPFEFGAGTWKAGSAETIVGGMWRAVTYTPVIGVGGLDLEAGDYFWVCHVTAGGGESPVMMVGKIRVV